MALNTLIKDNILTNRGVYESKWQYKTYTKAFKEKAVALVIEQGFAVPDAAQSLDTRANLLYGLKQQFEDKQSGNVLSGDDRSELIKLRKENKQLRLEKETFTIQLFIIMFVVLELSLTYC